MPWRFLQAHRRPSHLPRYSSTREENCAKLVNSSACVRRDREACRDCCSDGDAALVAARGGAGAPTPVQKLSARSTPSVETSAGGTPGFLQN